MSFVTGFLLPFRGAVNDVGPLSSEEKTWFDREMKRLFRRNLLIVSGKAALVTVAMAGIRLVERPERLFTWPTVVIGVGVFVLAFLRFEREQTTKSRNAMIGARRLHRAILAEPDLEPEHLE